MDNQYSYYQNLYNMFGGYNPLVDKKVAALRRLGFIIGCGMICFTLMQYAVAALLQIFGVYSLYQSDALFQTGISAIAPIIYVLLPFVLVYFLYNTEQKNIQSSEIKGAFSFLRIHGTACLLNRRQGNSRFLVTCECDRR